MKNDSTSLRICRYLPQVSDAAVAESRRTMARLLVKHRVMPPEVSKISRLLEEFNAYCWLCDPASQQPGEGLRAEWWWRPTITTSQAASEHRESGVDLLKRHGFSDEDVTTIFAASRIVALEASTMTRIAVAATDPQAGTC